MIMGCKKTTHHLRQLTDPYIASLQEREMGINEEVSL